ncbi:relaxase domain-containing protein [Actinomyces faecalis]|uniref:relaxase domain-containing protein n=1 Tax=Actinomyces faecalis TaxID=2722820 RepID=UPI0015553EDD|nr:relaxase domain-containing protein [Actinomyces faecalis]
MALSVRPLYANGAGSVRDALRYLSECEHGGQEAGGVERGLDYLEEDGHATPAMRVVGVSDQTQAFLEERLGVASGEALTADQVARLFGAEGQTHPLAPGSDERLGRAFERTMAGKHVRQSLRGQQMVFSAPKSVSVMAESSDEAVRGTIERAHR